MNHSRLWINFLHFYQPANAENDSIREATEKSYLRITKALESNPNTKFTVNISGCLLLRLEQLAYGDLIERIAKLSKLGQLEIVGTAAYHPLLPLVSSQEIIKQSKENEVIFRKYFGPEFKPRGYFMPEMAYSPRVAKVIKSLGYEWIILDEIACGGKLKQVDFKKRYIDSNSGLKVIFRSRFYSNTYVPGFLKQEVKDNSQNEIYITGTDGELYGLRHNDPSFIFENLLKENHFQTLTVSEYLDSLKEEEKCRVVSGSWESSEKEIENGEYYLLWYNKKNEIQVKIWELARLAYNTAEKNSSAEGYGWARWHLVRGLASCAFWWASDRDFSHSYGPQAWNPDEIEKRINELVKSIRALENVTDLRTKLKAEKLSLFIKEMVWEKHWRKRNM